MDASPVTTPIPKLALTVPEVAVSLGVPERRVYDLIAEEELAAFREGKRYIIPVWSVEAWLRHRMDRAGFADHLEHT